MRKGRLNTKHASGTECNVSVSKLVNLSIGFSLRNLYIDKSLRTFLKIIWFEKSIIFCMKKLEQKSSNLVAFFVAKLHVKSMSPGFYYGVRLSRENDIRRPGIPC